MIDDDEIAVMMNAPTREDMWIDFVKRHQLKTIAELGVARGIFAQGLLEGCPEISKYYLIDPWRHLARWNKPANKDNDAFEEFSTMR